MSEPFYKINNTNAVALTFDEEMIHAKAWKKKKDEKSRETLIKNYILFAVKTVKRSYAWLPEDDAVIVAHRALLDAINRFDPFRVKKGRLNNVIPYSVKIEFRKFMRESELVRCPIKNEREGRYISTDVRVSGKNSLSNGGPERGFVFDAVILDGTDETVDLDALLGCADSAADEMDRAERKEAVLAALQSLPDNLKQILMLVYFENKTFADIARERVPPLTRERIRQIHAEAIGVLRDALKKEAIFTL